MKNYGLFKKTFTTFCCSTLLISSFAMSKGSAETTISASEEDLLQSGYIGSEFDNLSPQDELYLEELGINEGSNFYNLLIAIEELPEGIEEEGAEGIAAWLSNRTGLAITAEGEYLNFDFLYEDDSSTQPSENESEEPTFSTLDFSIPGALACIGALGTLVPATKILKINKVLKAAGGAVTVMEQVYTNYKYYRNTKKYSMTRALNQAIEDFSVKEKLSSGSKSLLKDFFNVSAIAGSCGALFSYESTDENYLFDESNFKKLV